MFKYLLFKAIDLQKNLKILWEFVVFATISTMSLFEQYNIF